MNDIAAQIASYRPSQTAIDVVRSTKVALLVGISGAGKDTVKTELLRTGHYHNIVTNTTRQPRMNHGVREEDGVHYHFTAMDDMLGLLDRHELIEVNKYGENLYGSSVAEFQRAHDEDNIAIADIDVNGVRAFVDIAPNTTRPIFLVPPSYDVWYERWKKRYGDAYAEHLDDLASRRATAIAELRHALEASYFFDVINADLAETIKRVDEIARTGKQDPAEHQAGRDAVEAVLLQMEQL